MHIHPPPETPRGPRGAFQRLFAPSSHAIHPCALCPVPFSGAAGRRSLPRTIRSAMALAPAYQSPTTAMACSNNDIYSLLHPPPISNKVKPTARAPPSPTGRSACLKRATYIPPVF